MGFIWSLPGVQQRKIVVLLWDWWTTRNKVNAGDQRKSAEEMCHFINKHLLEFGTVPKPVAVPMSQSQG
jgi:hypothetical protein